MAKRVRRAEKAYSRKVKEAVHLFFFTHHRLPGVRGWELRQELGPDWLDVVEVLDAQLKPLDLKVTRVLDDPDAAADRDLYEESLQLAEQVVDQLLVLAPHRRCLSFVATVSSDSRTQNATVPRGAPSASAISR